MSHLVVITHKSCWTCPQSPSGYATDGGFPLQIEALSQLFEATTLLLPCEGAGPRPGQMPLVGRGLSVAPLTPLGRGNVQRKLLFPFWVVRNLPKLWREMSRATGVHALVPGDVGSMGMVLAAFLDKPLLVRHCGNWTGPRTLPERFCHWFMERFAGGRNVMLATGSGDESPCPANPALHWIFSSSLRVEELQTNAAAGPKALGSEVRSQKSEVGGRRSAGQLATSAFRPPISDLRFPTSALPSLPAAFPVRLICASRQEPAKGTRIIIEALPQILQHHPNVYLDVVGDGSCLDELKALARTLQLESRVVFHGKVAHGQVIKLLQEAHLFCFPTSSSEGFPKGVLEALSCALPVVTTRVSALPRLIASGEGCGVLLDQIDPAALARAVSDLINDPERYRQMSARAIQVAASYSLENWRDTIGGWLRESWGAATLNPARMPRQPLATADPAPLSR